jgi:hypothetical protein
MSEGLKEHACKLTPLAPDAAAFYTTKCGDARADVILAVSTEALFDNARSHALLNRRHDRRILAAAQSRATRDAEGNRCHVEPP